MADEAEVLTRISAFADKPMIPGRTLVFFDKVQKCSEVVTYIKYLVKDDGRFHMMMFLQKDILPEKMIYEI